MQSLTWLPKEARIWRSEVGELIIKNHRIVSAGSEGLWGYLLRAVRWQYESGDCTDMITEMECKGFQYEAVIEYCVEELESDHTMLTDVIYQHYIVTADWSAFYKFVADDAGRKIAQRFIEKIRNCDGWTEFLDTMKKRDGFYQEIKDEIKASWNVWCMDNDVCTYQKRT